MKVISVSSIFFVTCACVVTLASSSAFANDLFKSMAQEVSAPVENVFVPQGFDSNDNAEIVVSGTFPSSCYKMGKTHERFDDVEKKIYIDVTAYHVKSDFCLTVNIPFMDVIQLGTLSPSAYPIVVNKALTSEIPIGVAKSDGSSDNYNYASVHGLIRKGARKFEIQGVSPNQCYEISDLKVKAESKNVVLVLPIMTKVEGCDETRNPKAVNWIKGFEIPSDIKGKSLIHVRSLNGGSFNQVIEL